MVTNRERLNLMDNNQFADWLSDLVGCDICPALKECERQKKEAEEKNEYFNHYCPWIISDWLEIEAEETEE